MGSQVLQILEERKLWSREWKSLFDQLEHEVIESNQHNDEFRGKVVIQKYSGSTSQDSSSSSAENFQEETKLKKSPKNETFSNTYSCYLHSIDVSCT